MGPTAMVLAIGSHGGNRRKITTQPKLVHQTYRKRATPEVPQKRQMAYGGILHQPPTNRPPYFSTLYRLRPSDWRELTSGTYGHRV